jgi:hypothetical protein
VEIFADLWLSGGSQQIGQIFGDHTGCWQIFPSVGLGDGFLEIRYGGFVMSHQSVNLSTLGLLVGSQC